MATINLTKDDFGTTISTDGIVLVDYWAEWCGPCRSFGPIFEEVSEKHPDLTFAKVDTEAEHEIATALEIRSIPTLMAFRDGILVFNQPGALPAESLEQVIKAVRELNMDEVRQQVQSEQAEQA